MVIYCKYIAVIFLKILHGFEMLFCIINIELGALS